MWISSAFFCYRHTLETSLKRLQSDAAEVVLPVQDNVVYVTDRFDRSSGSLQNTLGRGGPAQHQRSLQSEIEETQKVIRMHIRYTNLFQFLFFFI